ncbi:MAG: hypothetical protein KBC15_01460 [Candidatus Levybacteria bacterium]|nr:hypothetical protein [Candidatus Levybacteria bacterium]
MEVSVQATDSLKIKGKTASVFFNPIDKTSQYNAAILLGSPAKSSLKIKDDIVVIDGPGEYEAGGIKITGTSVGEKTVFTLSVDGVEVLVGDRDALESAHQKLKEHHVLIVRAESVGTAGFASALGTNATVFFGAHANEVSDTLNKDSKKTVSKYSIVAGKFPAEVETIVLSSS